jgi:hypothetical protein
MRRAWLSGVLCALVVLTAACGGGTGIRPSSPLTAEHRRLFDNGFDWLTQPEALTGAWRDQWQEALELRVSESDLVAVVRLRALRADQNPEGRTTYRLIVDVDQVLFGTAPGSELSLTSTDDDPGYTSVRAKEQSAAGNDFIAYIKWYSDEYDIVQGRWQLTPASQALRDQTQALVARRGGAAAAR